MEKVSTKRSKNIPKIFLDKINFCSYIRIANVVTLEFNMRFVNVRELKSKTSEILRAAAGEDIIVTNHGKPVAVVYGIDGRDFENIGFRGGPRRIGEASAPYQTGAIENRKPEDGPPAWSPGETAHGNPLRAVFWDYPALTEEKAVREYAEEARHSPDREAFYWVLTRFLERGRVVDVRKFFSWSEIRLALPRLKLTPYARNKWVRMLEVYDRA
jgi:prevent-host-death family protein